MFYKRKEDSKEFLAGDQTLLKELAHPLKDQLPIGYSLAEARLDLGQASLPHRLKGSEMYYILQGRGRLHIEHESQELNQGDWALVPAGSEQ